MDRAFAREKHAPAQPAPQDGALSVVDMSRDAIIAVDPTLRVVFWNGGAARMFRYEVDEALGQPLLQLLSLQSSSAYMDALDRIWQAGHWEGELDAFRKDGGRITAISRWQLERDADGQARRILISNTDIRLWKRLNVDASCGRHASFDALFRQHPDGVAALDMQGGLTSANPALSALCGYAFPELMEMSLPALVEQSLAAQVRDAFVGACGGAPQSCEFTCVRKDGGMIDMAVTLLPVMEARRVIAIHAFFKDISERKRNESRILYLANHDALTGLPNRNLLYDRMKHACEQARRLGSKVAVLFMDLNRFKVINDSLGHETGDKLLRAVAHRLRYALRDGDTVARLGGDEFVVILENVRDAAHVAQVATTLLDVVAEPLALDGHLLAVSTSIGASLFPQDGHDPYILLKNADLAMYAAKEAGLGEFRFYEPAMNDRAVARLSRENSLRQAIANGEMVLHYQPRIDLRQQAIAGLEALVRWDHPRKGIVYPNHFIGLAEETGMIDALGDWVLLEACRQMCAWQDHGLGPIKVSVNISPLQLHSGRICDSLERALHETGIAPACLELEITENTLMQNIDSCARVLGEFQRMGISLSIDDFGTGYSSLSYLKRLPIDTLKIDKSFVRDLSQDEDDATIVSATIAMAHRLNLSVVAEGVSSVDQLRFLERFKCDEVQGYLLCQPLPAVEAESFLRTSALRGFACRWV